MHLIGVQFFVFSQVILRKALFFVEFINIGEEKWNRRQKKGQPEEGLATQDINLVDV
ncbi:hypothetical protein [Vibrio vulnificus]|uniref:hypothetical protein n=1 Tax=Vibrio vulnificus TaxID=672 RepID=UPI0026808C33|nr:hypothetical protein [Vibrio vulnificus]HAU8268484.1 hypothetical protein [Vibrio vulnificus]HDY7816147.1 hypothetical protein [Vibrio vulnificus]